MGLHERVGAALDRDGLLGISTSAPKSEIKASVEQRVTACVTGAVTALASGLADRSSGVGFEIDVGCEYDASTSEVDVEVSITVLQSGGDADIGLALLREGFRFFVEPGVFHATMTMELRPA